METERFKGTISFRAMHPDGKIKDEKYEKPWLVKFSSHENRFMMADDYCTNPECDCNDVSLWFLEIDETGHVASDPMQFNIRLDIETWQEKEEQGGSGHTRDFVGEFINNLPAELKDRFKGTYEGIRKRELNMEKFEMSADDIKKGRMVPYVDVFGDTGSPLSGGQQVGFIFEFDDKEYYVIDLYCINPACDCKEVQLVFITEKTEKNTASQIFDARLTLGGRIKEIDAYRCTKKEAKEIINGWKKSDFYVPGALKTRYDDMRKVGKRLVEKGGNLNKPTKRSTSAVRKEKIGRNMQCPCGSGKKYKKCCGKK